MDFQSPCRRSSPCFRRRSTVANLHFVELGSGTVFSASAADIAVTLTGDELGGVGIGFFPSPATAREILADTVYGDPAVYPRPEGDIFFDNFNSELKPPGEAMHCTEGQVTPTPDI